MEEGQNPPKSSPGSPGRGVICPRRCWGGGKRPLRAPFPKLFPPLPLADPPPALPYFVRRSRMHNVPVYRDLTHGNRKMTVIRKIEGDIWALEGELKAFLGRRAGREPLTQVNELTGTLRIKGYFDGEVKAWLLEKGF
ncbi:39S ribosomal protein L49, mitochondrial [Apteryx rowi]|uniref:39S ribosomal protein L49, mitochondrial n=1 Tax=Apteryx rowi TaxID=308060 RepID=UPI000E1C4910|nr:39S ribosomal protein L49, mitochondrial [Apteryx rowi]